MRFSYYDRLSRAQRRVYDASDRVAVVPLPDAGALAPAVEALRRALEGGRRAAVERAAGRLVDALLEALRVEPARTSVLAVRPRGRGGELHGLYTRVEGQPALLQVWMRTAAHRRVVAFRTFVRTLLHEVCHHLDYALLGLPDSFHTEGFFRRESSLSRQLLGRRTRVETPRAPREGQLELPFGDGSSRAAGSDTDRRARIVPAFGLPRSPRPRSR